ncbi:MAG: lytic transglycosylase domain-containing protein [Gemmatimonadota bacterium]|nr:lytic transglycosylase domain-containing protein [Gemmatimonadota bacterium]
MLAAIYAHPAKIGAPSSVVLQLSWRDSVTKMAPWADTLAADSYDSPQFELDRRAFAQDLLRTGNLDSGRADSLATLAVREAYRRRVPPALVFGILMTENGDLVSSARSKVGAIGLMQIDPRAWMRSLGKHFGTNLRDDATNLRYGVFILSHYLYGADDSSTTDSSVRRGLLRYNGCVRGTNTRDCQRYPDVVRARIERLAVSQCGARGYDKCVSEPLQVSMGN